MPGTYLIAIAGIGLYGLLVCIGTYCVMDPEKLDGFIRVVGIAILLVCLAITGIFINYVYTH